MQRVMPTPKSTGRGSGIVFQGHGSPDLWGRGLIIRQPLRKRKLTHYPEFLLLSRCPLGIFSSHMTENQEMTRLSPCFGITSITWLCSGLPAGYLRDKPSERPRSTKYPELRSWRV